MNKARRTQIKEAIQRIEDLMQNILNDEQEAYDNIPENLQGSYRGMESEEAQENLEAAIEALEEAISYLEEIC